MSHAVTARPGGVAILVRVQPGARRNEVTGRYAHAVKIRVAAPPVDGKANDALVTFVAQRLAVPRSRVRIVAGASGRLKRLAVDGVSVEAARAALGLT